MQELLGPDVLQVFKELGEDDDQVPELDEAEDHLAFSPQAQQHTRGVRSDSSETLRCFHCGLPFCRVAPAVRQTRGGARVKRFLTTRQKLLFPQTWMKSYTCACESA